MEVRVPPAFHSLRVASKNSTFQGLSPQGALSSFTDSRSFLVFMSSRFLDLEHWWVKCLSTFDNVASLC